ncbi:hypothetical protein BVI434_2470024 [Burkholderia vietnamiensis]|nr:hypothetical protein BVI434_2470024 [Burkholderia vietnamiensis]
MPELTHWDEPQCYGTGGFGTEDPEPWPSLPWDAKAFAVCVASTRCRRLTESRTVSR